MKYESDMNGNFTMGSIQSQGSTYSVDPQVEIISDVAEDFTKKQAMTMQRLLSALGLSVSPKIVTTGFALIGGLTIMKMLKGNLVKVGAAGMAMYLYNQNKNKKTVSNKTLVKVSPIVEQISNSLTTGPIRMG